MERPRFALLAAIVATLFLPACATIMQGTTQQVSISSSPSSARVSINGTQNGQTPVVVDLRRKDTHMVKIELDGYQPYETVLTRKVSGWVWGNVLVGGLIGLAVDATTGGMYQLTPEQVTAELKGFRAAAGAGDERLLIAVVLTPDPSWQKVGQLRALAN